MTLAFDSVFITGTGKFLPGEPIDNDRLDSFIVPLGPRANGVKRRILADNGIRTRHYAIDTEGRTVFSAGDMATRAVHACLDNSGIDLSEVSVLCTGSCGGDLAVPGFANMVQGALGAGPMLTSSHQGVCAAGMAALSHAASAVSLGRHQHALVVASEFPSRMFKRSRFAPRDYHSDFAAHFLRYMLSDGAAAWMLSREPAAGRCSLRLDWVHTRSFSGDHPVCMQIGAAADGGPSYLDYPSLSEAEQAGAFLLRQDLRLLPRLFELGVHEYVELIRRELLVPREIEHFLCHYSSAKFAPVVEELLEKTGFGIDRARWYSNLETRGNTGAASLFIMLDDFLRERRVEPGQRILCFVPESGRFTVSFAQLTVVDVAGAAGDPAVIRAPHDAGSAGSPAMAALIADLASVWHDYQSRLRRTRFVQSITRSEFTLAQYLGWMRVWIPQVRNGSLWMRRALSQLREPYLALRELVEAHASDEQNDYAILFDDYKLAGGPERDVDALARNPGGEALNAFMFSCAERPNPIDLLGAMYIIEGTGQRVIPQLLPSIRAQLRLPAAAFRFLNYHAGNDQAHLSRWLRAAELVLEHDPDGSARERIVRTARATTDLYLLQFEYLTEHG